MKVVDRGSLGGSPEGSETRIGRWSDGKATTQRQLIVGAKCADAKDTSGEEGGWFAEEGRRVWTSVLRKTRELSAAEEARDAPRPSESAECHVA